MSNADDESTKPVLREPPDVGWLDMEIVHEDRDPNRIMLETRREEE